MRKRLLAAAFAGALFVGVFLPLGSALAAPNPHACHGQVASEEARDHGGMAKAAQEDGFDSVHELQQAITAFCS